MLSVLSELDGLFPVFPNFLLGRDDAPLPTPGLFHEKLPPLVFLEIALNVQSQKREKGALTAGGRCRSRNAGSSIKHTQMIATFTSSVLSSYILVSAQNWVEDGKSGW